jgi:single-stranded DNA-binding protein
MNDVSLFGHLDGEPELSGMPGRDVCEFWLAVHGRRDKHTLYVKITTFRGLAVRLAEELHTGAQVAVTGHLRSERWPGQRRLYRHTVVAREVQLAGASEGSGAGDDGAKEEL